MTALTWGLFAERSRDEAERKELKSVALTNRETLKTLQDSIAGSTRRTQSAITIVLEGNRLAVCEEIRKALRETGADVSLTCKKGKE